MLLLIPIVTFLHTVFIVICVFFIYYINVYGITGSPILYEKEKIFTIY